MSDARIRELEHALRAGDDPALRLRLATLLARAGRRREALERLDLARVSEEERANASELASELWRGELETFARRVAFDAPGVKRVAVGSPLVAWIDDRGLHAADGTTGEVVHEDRTGEWVGLAGVAGRTFALDVKGRRLVAIEPGSTREASLDADAVIDASPSGDRVLVARQHSASVLAWPGLAKLVERRTSGRPIADWNGGHLLALNGVGLVEFVALKGGLPKVLDAGGPDRVLTLLGNGVLSDTTEGLILRPIRGKWTLVLFFTSGVQQYVASLARDGRSVRALVGESVLRWDVDLGQGKVRSAPPELDARVRAAAPPKIDRDETPVPLAWHPHADVVARAWPEARFDVIGASGVLHRKLVGHPVRWTQDGLGLVVVVDGAPSRVEVWGGAPSSA